ncbi:MAG: hypothetical protein HFI31_15890 [Lachnospiraceae bacterium]|nr:hypothetical protein [Lachnospiraceae bacterium]
MKTFLSIRIRTWALLFGLELLLFAGFFSLKHTAAREDVSVFLQEDFPQASLQISEVCYANPGTTLGDCVVYEDYIELYNPSSLSVSLEGLYLYDSSEELYEHPLPGDITMNPGEYLVLYAVGTEGSAPENCMSLPFRLSAGDTVFLGCKAESLYEITDSVTIPALDAGAVYARLEESFLSMRPSPGTPNEAGAQVLPSPVFSVPGGFYQGELTLSLTGPEDAALYYTLDGSEPTCDSLLYTEPLVLSDPSPLENRLASREDITAGDKPYTAPEAPVDKAVTIRAMAVDEDGNYSNPATATYFLNYHDKYGYENAVVVSLIADPDSLFGPDNGIYVLGTPYEEGLHSGEISEASYWFDLFSYTNYFKDGPESERKAHVELFQADRQLAFAQDCGIRIRGNATRIFPQKSFTLFSRNRYGASSFTSVPFDPELSYSDLILNNSSQLNKVFFFSLLEDRAASFQHYTPCQVFLNGEYWGMYFLMEKYSAELLGKRYGLEEESILLIKDSWDVQDGKEEDFSHFEALMELMEQDLSDPAVYAQVLEQIDLQNFLDWLCTNIYICNTDAGVFGRNVYVWKYLPDNTIPNSSTSPSGQGEENEYMDGRWRWMLYDLDDSLGVTLDPAKGPGYAYDSLKDYLSWPPTASLIRNPAFRRQFVITFQDMANETFSPEHVEEQLEPLLKDGDSWSALHNSRWTPREQDSTFTEQAEALRQFFSLRREFIYPCLAKSCRLKGQLCTLTLQQTGGEAGHIRLNTISPDLSHGSWSGMYYSDYPMELSVEPEKAPTFVRWELSGASLLGGSLTDPEIRVQLAQPEAQVIAVFQ